MSTKEEAVDELNDIVDRIEAIINEHKGTCIVSVTLDGGDEGIKGAAELIMGRQKNIAMLNLKLFQEFHSMGDDFGAKLLQTLVKFYDHLLQGESKNGDSRDSGTTKG